jgi:cell wall-associated NlpC family hydrolase
MTRLQAKGMRVGIAAGLVLFSPVAALAGIGAGLATTSTATSPSRLARADIPPHLLHLYVQGSQRCPGLPWPILAGIGKVESDHNRPTGQVSRTGAEGPMQFMPATWEQYGSDADGDGRADPFDPADAIPTAANYLCDHNATVDLTAAVASYPCGELSPCLARAALPHGYASRVLAWATRYSDQTQMGGPAATLAVQVALGQLGTPYRWGGEQPGAGFDCSGLVQYAYGRAGVALPRTAQQQYDTGPHLPDDSDAWPGDLVFFGASPTAVTHVGIALGLGRMVDAPHTGALVRVESIAGFGHYVGATRPTSSIQPGAAA